MIIYLLSNNNRVIKCVKSWIQGLSGCIINLLLTIISILCKIYAKTLQLSYFKTSLVDDRKVIESRNKDKTENFTPLKHLKQNCSISAPKPPQWNDEQIFFPHILGNSLSHFTELFENIERTSSLSQNVQQNDMRKSEDELWQVHLRTMAFNEAAFFTSVKSSFSNRISTADKSLKITPTGNDNRKTIRTEMKSHPLRKSFNGFIEGSFDIGDNDDSKERLNLCSDGIQSIAKSSADCSVKGGKLEYNPSIKSENTDLLIVGETKSRQDTSTGNENNLVFLNTTTSPETESYLIDNTQTTEKTDFTTDIDFCEQKNFQLGGSFYLKNEIGEINDISHAKPVSGTLNDEFFLMNADLPYSNENDSKNNSKINISSILDWNLETMDVLNETFLQRSKFKTGLRTIAEFTNPYDTDESRTTTATLFDSKVFYNHRNNIRMEEKLRLEGVSNISCSEIHSQLSNHNKTELAQFCPIEGNMTPQLLLNDEEIHSPADLLVWAANQKSNYPECTRLYNCELNISGDVKNARHKLFGCCSSCKRLKNPIECSIYGGFSITKGELNSSVEDEMKEINFPEEKNRIATDTEKTSCQNVENVLLRTNQYAAVKSAFNKKPYREVNFSNSVELLAYEPHKSIFENFNPRPLFLLEMPTPVEGSERLENSTESYKSLKSLLQKESKDSLEINKNMEFFTSKTQKKKHSQISDTSAPADLLNNVEDDTSGSNFSMDSTNFNGDTFYSVNLSSPAQTDNEVLIARAQSNAVHGSVSSKLGILGRRIDTAMQRLRVSKFKVESKISLQKLRSKIMKP